MKLIALKPLYRVNRGERFEIADHVGRLAVLLGWARADDEDVKDDVPVRRQTYRRRDLRAEE